MLNGKRLSLNGGVCGSFFLLLSSCDQKVIKWQLILLEMMKYSLKWSHYSLNTHFEWEKLTFDDFLVTTWEREVESQRKKETTNSTPMMFVRSLFWICPLAQWIKLSFVYFWPIQEETVFRKLTVKFIISNTKKSSRLVILHQSWMIWQEAL